MTHSESLSSRSPRPGRTFGPSMPGRTLARKFLATGVWLGMVLATSACGIFGGAGIQLQPGINNTAQPGTPAKVALTDQQTVRQQAGARAANVLGSEELIAADLVNAIVQIDKLHPSHVTLQMSERPEAFASTLKFVLEQAGYNFSSFSTGTQHTPVSVKSRELDRMGTGLYRRYQVNLGTIKFRREYFIQPQGVSPSSDLLVKGVDASRIVLNEEIFEDSARPAIQPAAITAANGYKDSTAPVQSTPAQSSPVQRTPIQITQVRTAPVKSAPVQTAPVPQAVPLQREYTAQLPALATAKAISPQHDHSHNHHGADNSVRDPFKIKKNRYELGHSNFARLTENFFDVKSQILVFANDSLVLGRKNKATVLAFTEPFIEDSDVISIVGCSHGRTTIPNGNILLATGRAQRVKEAFLIAGVAEDRILEEGCWSATDDVSNPHPSRGVIVTLRRELRNG